MLKVGSYLKSDVVYIWNDFHQYDAICFTHAQDKGSAVPFLAGPHLYLPAEHLAGLLLERQGGHAGESVCAWTGGQQRTGSLTATTASFPRNPEATKQDIQKNACS
ncbi:hypothetical protein Y1Q_0019290 [Alligator mississippiensis]|uniref:Uncharacterized protein n=1 Tax=Alligator mississippiensis TaxID=8496 RepID=A0A151MR10_ALLMI|nr:hypothetical protein Y1Q_0019290 [Alligator mississippiensis]